MVSKFLIKNIFLINQIIKGGRKNMQTFFEIWNSEVRKLAEACITEPRLIEIMSKGEDYKKTKDENEYFENLKKQYKDIRGMYCIWNMIFAVDYFLTHSNEKGALNQIENVYSVLISRNYLKNIFNDNQESTEWKSRAALRDGLEKILNL